MRQRTRKVKIWVPCLFGACALLLAGSVWRHLTFGPRQTETIWSLDHHWRIESCSGRSIVYLDNDDRPGGPVTPPCQAYQYRGEQFGPVVVVSKRPVPLGPGEVCD